LLLSKAKINALYDPHSYASISPVFIIEFDTEHAESVSGAISTGNHYEGIGPTGKQHTSYLKQNSYTAIDSFVQMQNN